MVRGCFSTSGPSLFCRTWIFFVPLDHQLPTLAGYPSVSLVKALDLESANDLTCSDETDNWNTSCFDNFASALLAVD